MGGVLSRAEGFTDVGSLAPALAFHAISMVLGTYLVGRAAQVGRVARAEQAIAQE